MGRYLIQRYGLCLVFAWNLGISVLPGTQAMVKAQPWPLDDLIVSCVVPSTGQLVCHPVHDPCQGESGPCPESGGDRQWEPRGDGGESAPPGATLLRG